MTPRQLFARVHFIDRRERHHAALMLFAFRMAQNNDPNAVEAAFGRLQQDFPT